MAAFQRRRARVEARGACQPIGCGGPEARKRARDPKAAAISGFRAFGLSGSRKKSKQVEVSKVLEEFFDLK